MIEGMLQHDELDVCVTPGQPSGEDVGAMGFIRVVHQAAIPVVLVLVIKPCHMSGGVLRTWCKGSPNSTFSETPKVYGRALSSTQALQEWQSDEIFISA